MKVLWVICLVVIMWVIEVVNAGVDHRLSTFGILPREFSGIPGIFFWPFLHANYYHLMANTFPFAALAWFVMASGMWVFVRTLVMITLLAGTAVWLLGRSAYHVGASGLIFGFFGFLVARAIYEKSLMSVIVACIAVFFYGGMIWGILPSGATVSWEGHLFGLIAGIISARVQYNS